MPPSRVLLSWVLVLATLVAAGVFPGAGIVAPAAAQSSAAPPGAQPDGSAPSTVPSVPRAVPRPRASGYLGADRVPDHLAFLPPPPAAGSALGEADVAIFEATRALESGPRWQLAAADDRINQKSMLGSFSCSLGVDLATAELPALSRLLSRAGADLFPVIGAAKDQYQRPRPFVTEQGPVCITPSEDLAKSGSYPSGHAASGWLYALLLAEIDPVDAAAIVNRGRAFGESRVVCGVHYVSDIEGGRLTATAILAALHGTPEFETDVAAARAEVTSLHAANAAKPAAAACENEGANLTTPW
jgi:acid phosphatase (class A)